MEQSRTAPLNLFWMDFSAFDFWPAEGNLKHPGHLETVQPTELKAEVRRTQDTLSKFPNLFQTSMWQLPNPEQKNILGAIFQLATDTKFLNIPFSTTLWKIRLFEERHSGWFVFISWEKWVSAGQNGRKIWGGNNSSRQEKLFPQKSAQDEVECRKSCHVCLS